MSEPSRTSIVSRYVPGANDASGRSHVYSAARVLAKASAPTLPVADDTGRPHRVEHVRRHLYACPGCFPPW